MTLLIDTGSYAWRASYSLNFSWAKTDHYVENGAIFCLDSNASVRHQKLPWYKQNRPKNEVQYPEQAKHKAMAARFVEFFKRRYTSSCYYELDGAEADDGIAILVKPGDKVMSLDKDMLTINVDFDLIDTNNKQWGMERFWKLSIPISRGRSFLAYQLMVGDTADNIPRLLLSSDRKTLPFVMQQENPLYWAISILPEEKVRASLNALMLPTPLLWDNDPIEEAMKL